MADVSVSILSEYGGTVRGKMGTQSPIPIFGFRSVP